MEASPKYFNMLNGYAPNSGRIEIGIVAKHSTLNITLYVDHKARFEYQLYSIRLVSKTPFPLPGK